MYEVCAWMTKQRIDEIPEGKRLFGRPDHRRKIN
jgi:hypothetical protein